MKKINKLWGTAFKKAPKESTIKFTAGRDVYSKNPADYNLIPYDIWGNKAHCVMLYKQGLINKKDAKVILKGLKEIESLWKKGKFQLDPSKEDVHTNIESWIIKKYGIDNAGKLHTARSRNDQSSLDIKLYLRDKVLAFLKANISLIKTLLAKEKKYKDLVMPGFTHHQHAMVTSFNHTLMAFASMLLRDNKRFENWFNLHNFNPLGSIAAYGTSFSIDKKLTAKFFGFYGLEENSLDTITNKWEAESDLAFAITVLINHLSLIAQTFIIFSTPEFSFVQLDEKYSTGSSIMPQKKNPDPLEVIKAKASFASGILQSLVGIGKGNFIGYNRDSQWSKYFIMDLVEECITAPEILKEIVETLIINKNKMKEWAQKSFIGATSVVEQLVSNHRIPFRKAKVIVEKAIKYSQDKDKITYQALLKALNQEKSKVKIKKNEITKWQDPEWIIKQLKSHGGPGFKSMKEMKKNITGKLRFQEKFLSEKKKKIKKAYELLNKEINKILNI